MFNAKAIDSIYLHPSDNVCVAARDLPAGATVSAGGHSITLVTPVRLGHKIAIAPIAAGQPAIKYGQTIGFATAAIAPGTWIHTHNLDGRRVRPRLRTPRAKCHPTRRR